MGDVCEEGHIDVKPNTIDRKILVNVEVDQEYNNNFENKSSEEYKNFVSDFTRQMFEYYNSKIDHLKEVVVISLSPGNLLVRSSRNTVEKRRKRAEDTEGYRNTRSVGVKVEHDVVLEIPNDVTHESLYANDTEAIKQAVSGLVNCTDGCPTLPITQEPTVNTTEPDHGAFCVNVVEDADLAVYYQLFNDSGVLSCVSSCDSKHTNSKTCYNNGKCRIFIATGAVCECVDVTSTWYLGDDCSMPIYRTPLIAGLSVTLAVLLVLIGVMTAFVLRNRHMQERKRDPRQMQVDEWLDEDFECSQLKFGGSIRTYRNPSFPQHVQAAHREDPDLSRRLASVNQSAGPPSDHRQSDRTSSPLQQDQGHISPSDNTRSPQSVGAAGLYTNPMRINRPEIRMSWDA
ncbi:mucin-2-like%2C partial [Xyrichtys novacula]|uniref:Mucin-2-like, partial n=1 Tax=Xyrichtys novacula TaxID=13765 RepID=A0AAV1HLK0_XYRNO|nr:mucin-2-like%2C partial [Xyrichtys novacula]